MRIQIGSKHVMLPEFVNKFVISKVIADVTLASDDGITLSAHKISPQFKFEFKSLPKSNALTSRTSTLSVANMLGYGRTCFMRKSF